MSQIELVDILTFSTPILVSSLSLAAAHWFPWHNGARPLRRQSAYTVGTAVVVGVPVATMLLSVALGAHYPTLFWAALLAVNTVMAGATVNVAYWIDSRRAIGHGEVANAARGR